jgi:hypothetical protein
MINEYAFYSTCNCCGQGIKNKIYISGKVYGLTCGAKLLGLNPSLVRSYTDAKGVVNLEKIKAQTEMIAKWNEEAKAKKEYELSHVIPRFNQITANALTIKLAGSIKSGKGMWHVSKMRFLTSILNHLLLKGYISMNQLVAVSKSIKYTYTDADLFLTEKQEYFNYQHNVDPDYQHPEDKTLYNDIYNFVENNAGHLGTYNYYSQI